MERRVRKALEAKGAALEVVPAAGAQPRVRSWISDQNCDPDLYGPLRDKALDKALDKASTKQDGSATRQVSPMQPTS